MPVDKPKQSEEEYFARLENEKKKNLREKAVREAERKEAEDLRLLHWMHCPKCGRDLKEIAFRGVKIDKCTGCAGVWLDDGELETLSGRESGVLKNILAAFRSK